MRAKYLRSSARSQRVPAIHARSSDTIVMRAGRLAACLLATVVLGAGVAACTQQPTLVSPRAFNRPARVTFLCFEGETPTALAECAPQEDGTQRDGFTLIGLVPQQTRGEVAAVDLSSSPARVLDSDRRVPGYTFVPVGEVPTAIAISPTNPRCTWVANRGSRDLTVIETVRFREESLAEQQIGAGLSFLDGTGLESGRPQAMELVEMGTTAELFVTLPEDGAIARLVVVDSETECRVETIEILPVPTDVPADPAGLPTDPTLLASEAQDPATLAICPVAAAPQLASIPADVEIAPIDPTTLLPPEPFEMVVERDGDTPIALWIGDAARPIIHRYDLTTRAFDGSLRAAAPVRDLAITPPVPDSLDAGAPTRRYLYAIDDRDGTVFVMDASTGHVLPVAPDVARRRDRIPFRASARAIEVISTSGERRTGDECTAQPDLAPTLLRGVFVSVALSDGTIRFVDVYDLDASCRNGGTNASECHFELNETLSFVGRHRPRIGSRIATGVALDQPPTANLGGSTLRYGEDGTVPMESATPTFAELGDACPSGLGQVYPTSGNPRICTVADPWASEQETWSITWQGAIPGTASTAGNLQPLDADGVVVIDTGIELCSRGALAADGAAAVPAGQGEPEEGYAGDLVAITSPLPDATESDVACRSLVGLETSDTQRPVLLPIREIVTAPSGGSRIVIAADAPVVDRDGMTVQDVLRCFAPTADTEELVGFDVRVREGYAVVGSRTGFAHRVVRVGDRCEVDVTQDPLQQGRAFVGRRFDSERLALSLVYPATAIGRPDLTISFTVTDAPNQLFVSLAAVGSTTSTGTLPTEIVWNALDQRLYAIDEVRRGLVRIPISPIGSPAPTVVE